MTTTPPPFETTVGMNNGEIDEDYAEATPVYPRTNHTPTDPDTNSAEINAIKAYVIDSDDDSEISEIYALNVDILPTRVETAKKARSKLCLYTIFAILGLWTIFPKIVWTTIICCEHSIINLF